MWLHIFLNHLTHAFMWSEYCNLMSWLYYNSICHMMNVRFCWCIHSQNKGREMRDTHTHIHVQQSTFDWSDIKAIAIRFKRNYHPFSHTHSLAQPIWILLLFTMMRSSRAQIIAYVIIIIIIMLPFAHFTAGCRAEMCLQCHFRIDSQSICSFLGNSMPNNSLLKHCYYVIFIEFS